MAAQLSALEVIEVSLVDMPANKRRYVAVKAEDQPVESVVAEAEPAVADTAPATAPAIDPDAVREYLDSLSPEERAKLAGIPAPVEVEKAWQTVEVLKRQVEALEDERQMARYREVARDWPIDSPEDHAKRLLAIQKALGEQAVADEVKRWNAVATQAAAAASLTAELGTAQAAASAGSSMDAVRKALADAGVAPDAPLTDRLRVLRAAGIQVS